MLLPWLLILFFAILALLLLTALVWLVIASLKGAPFVPTSQSHLTQMIDLAQIKPGDKAIDLGSGDGRLVIAMAKAGAQAEGYEIQPFLIIWSKLKTRLVARSIPTTGSARFFQQNLWQANCHGAQIVTLYAFPSMMAQLEQKLTQELTPGAKVISLAFTFPNWQPIQTQGKIRVYQR